MDLLLCNVFNCRKKNGDNTEKNASHDTAVIVTLTVILLIIVLLSVFAWFWRRKKERKKELPNNGEFLA